MLEEGLEDGIGHGGDVGPQKGGLRHVAGVADGGGDDPHRQVLDLPHLHDLPQKLSPVPGDVVHPAQEGAHVAGPRPGRQEGLVGGEDEGHVDPDALGAQYPAGLEALLGGGELDHDVGVEGGEPSSLLHHGLGLEGRDLGGDGPSG